MKYELQCEFYKLAGITVVFHSMSDDGAIQRTRTLLERLEVDGDEAYRTELINLITREIVSI